jgi:hypothetical protein
MIKYSLVVSWKFCTFVRGDSSTKVEEKIGASKFFGGF